MHNIDYKKDIAITTHLNLVLYNNDRQQSDALTIFLNDVFSMVAMVMVEAVACTLTLYKCQSIPFFPQQPFPFL